jgi:hypothetical protein
MPTLEQRRAFEKEMRESTRPGEVVIPRAFGRKAGAGKRFEELTHSELCGLQVCLGLPDDNSYFGRDNESDFDAA